MPYLLGPKEKKSRALGTNLFLKAERSTSQKSAMVRRPYRPGAHGKRRRGLSEFGIELHEKQKVRLTYGMRERQFEKYVEEAMSQKTVTSQEALARLLETRIDSLVFRAGLAPSRSIARFLVSHGHIVVDGRRADIPSLQLKPGQSFGIRPESKEKKLFSNLPTYLKKYQAPEWLLLDKENWRAELKDWPSLDQLHSPFDLALVLEFYSR